MNKKTLNKVVAISLLMIFAPISYASIILNGTRIIYQSNQKEVTMKVTNKGKSPVLIQSWIDNGNTTDKPENIKVPFIITPPINRIDPDKGQTLRITYTGAPLAGDRESIYWLNVLEIPAKKPELISDNYLQVAFRSRIKVFMRPASLAGNAADAAKKVIWSAENGKLKATNKSGYFISLATVTLNGNKIDAPMISPQGSETLAVKANAGQKLKYIYINDYGAYLAQDAVVQ